MTQAAERIVGHLGISGLWGLDFILEEKTGAAYLIEMNPRATPICHLALGAGQDLAGALCAQLSNTTPIPSPVLTQQNVIALFPGEWHRDPASPYLRSAFHDIPWEEPDLVRDGLQQPWSERGLIARTLARYELRSPHQNMPGKLRETGILNAYRTKYVR